MKYREKLLVSAMLGKLTDLWRDGCADTEDAEGLIRGTPAPPQPRGGRDATDEIIPGIGALSVNHPGTEPPPGWFRTPLLRIARQESGHTPSRNHPEYWGGEVPWIAIRDAGAHHGRTIHDTMQKPTMLGIENSSARLLPAGTVCLSRTASVGYVTVMGCPMATSQDFVTWTCTPALLPDFLKYALMAEGDEIRRFGKGSTHTTIYFPEIRALHICLPPLAEQKEIVARLDRAFAAAELVERESTRALALLDRLEQSILTRAFRGELVRQEPADEAAAVALERFAITTQEKPRRRLKATAAA